MSEEITLIETEESDSKSIFDKTGDELTVGDAVKLQAAGFAATIIASVAAGAIAYGGVVTIEKVVDWKRRRRWEKELRAAEMVQEAYEVEAAED